MTQPKRSINWRKITESKLFFPVLALAIILLLDLILVPNFFSFQVRDGNLYGSLIDIMRNAAPVMIISLGMTMVIATGGVDLSVGAIMAIVSSLAAVMMMCEGASRTLIEGLREGKRPIDLLFRT